MAKINTVTGTMDKEKASAKVALRTLKPVNAPSAARNAGKIMPVGEDTKTILGLDRAMNKLTPSPQEVVPTTTTTDPGGFNAGDLASRPALTSSDPYIQSAELANQEYWNAYKTRLEGLQKQAKTNYDTANGKYDRSAKATYGNYLEALKNQKASASNNGMTGGAVERMRVDSANNYNKGYAANEAGRTQTLSGIQSDYDARALEAYGDYANTTINNLYNAKVTAQQAADQKAADEAARKLSQEQFAAQQKMEAEKFAYQKQTDKKTDFLNTVNRYNSWKKANEAIKKLDKKDPLYDYKRAVLLAQRAKYKKK